MKIRYLAPLAAALLWLPACGSDNNDNTGGGTGTDVADTAGGGDAGGTTSDAGTTGDAGGTTGDVAMDVENMDGMDMGGTGTDEGGTGADTADAGGGTAGQPRGKDNPPTPGAQIDRMGRPAIATATIMPFEPDKTKQGAEKDKYNAAKPADWAGFAADIAGSLAILDALDGNCGNQLLAGSEVTATRYATLSGALAQDRLLLDASQKTCGYLGVEAHAVAGAPASCGGRQPTDDVIATSYSALAAGVLSGVDDGITTDDGGAQNTDFPFLGAPK